MQEEETTVMKIKRSIKDEETEAKRPRVEAEPKNTINSDIDMDDELNKLKMQNWNFMSMVTGNDFRREKIDNGSCENLRNGNQMQFLEERTDQRRT